MPAEAVKQALTAIPTADIAGYNRPVGLDEEVAFANVGRRGSYAVGVGCATAAREAKLPPVF
jgi:hypothetical protein